MTPLRAGLEAAVFVFLLGSLFALLIVVDAIVNHP